MASKKRKTKPAPTELEQLLGHRFARPELLRLALTHRSSVYDPHPTTPVEIEAAEDPADPSRDNEQLEFLGDAVLGLLAAEMLCTQFPALREGELTRLRATLVSSKHLGKVGTALGLGQYLQLGATTEENGGRTNAQLAANAVEAIIAAVYLDAGLEAARKFVATHVMGSALDDVERSLTSGEHFSDVIGDHKSALQERLQAQGLPRPRYVLAGESGPGHRKLFRIEVRTAAGDLLAEAERTSKKEAEQEAARLALIKLQAEPKPA